MIRDTRKRTVPNDAAEAPAFHLTAPAHIAYRRHMEHQRPVIQIGYDHAFNVIRGFEPRVRAFAPQAVVGVARGGTVPATMLAQLLGLPCWMLAASRGQPLAWDHDGAPPTRLTVVDDIASTGGTMARVVRFLAAAGHTVQSCAMFHDPASGFVPDVSHPAPAYIRFVWEFRDGTPGSRRARLIEGGVPAFEESEYFGLDLDGVLVRDLPRRWYRRGERNATALGTVLDVRDAAAPVAVAQLPQIDYLHACVITGRPEEDHARTRAWLDRNGFGGLPLHCRPRRYAPAQHALWKAEAILEYGVSRYFESDLRQAIAISRACPATEVYWWGKSRDKRLRLSTSEVPGFADRQ